MWSTETFVLFYFTMDIVLKFITHYDKTEFLPISNVFIKEYGFLQGSYLSLLLKHAATQDEWFYYTIDAQMADMHLTRKKVKICKSFFIEKEILLIQPAKAGKEYYKINFEILLNVIK